MPPTHNIVSPSYSSAAPTIVAVISFVFVLFLITEGWLW